MKWPEFSDPKKMFVVTCFVQDGDLENKKQDLESLGNQRNVKLVVQPCPYEGIEFLFRIDADLLGHFSSLDESLYWKALSINPQTPKNIVEKIAGHFHAYFCAILEQNGEGVKKEGIALDQLKDHFVATGENR